MCNVDMPQHRRNPIGPIQDGLWKTRTYYQLSMLSNKKGFLSYSSA